MQAQWDKMRWTLGNLLVALLQLYESLTLAGREQLNVLCFPLYTARMTTQDKMKLSPTLKRSHAAQKSGNKQAENRTVDSTVQKF